MWQARMYPYAHAWYIAEHGNNHAAMSTLRSCCGPSAPVWQKRAFSPQTPSQDVFPESVYHNIPLPALLCKGGLRGWRCINVLGLCVLTHITPRGSALSHCRTSSLLPARNTWRMLRLQIFPCACAHTGCYGIAELLLHLHTCRMLR